MATDGIEAKGTVAELESDIQRTAYENVAVECVEKARMLLSAVGFVLAAADRGLIPDASHMQHLDGSPDEEWPDASEIVAFLHSQARSERDTAKDVEITKSFIT